ncbi:telomerase reverse transcriptase isoform X3 [Megachile rotundata]|uniref:telomerase reverse transcriptase isoform X3 n=1 Tax=Megachile rotundata TaxID=143995 RepID=UPI003FD67822
MDNITAENAKEVFGTHFQQYCLDHQIILTKNKCGAFMVPNIGALKQCLQFLDELKLKLHCKLKKMQTSSPIDLNYENQYHNGQRICKQYKFCTKKKQIVCEEITNTHPNYFTNLALKIYLYDSSQILPSYTCRSIPIQCILDTSKSGNEIYEFIINTIKSDVIITDYEASIPAMSALLEEFKKRHKKFHYFSILKHIISKQKLNQKSKCEYEINMKQMKLFFDLVFAKVVPLNIFGKLRNIKKMKKALFHLLNTPRFKTLDLSLYINKLDIFSIKWAQNIKSIKVKWLIIAIFVKWFFTEFLIKILHIYFHVTVPNNSNKRLYIARSDWCKINTKFINHKKYSNALQPDIKCNDWNPSIGIYKSHPKHSTVRPIFVAQYKNNNEEKHLHVLHKFLRQLHITEYGLNTFEEQWRSIIQTKSLLKNEKMYLISCDVMDAFGSIVQGKLYDIIRLLCDKLPEDLILRYYIVKSRRAMNDIVCYKQYICDSHLQLPFAPATLYVRTNHTQRIKKSWLLDKIYKYIFYQRVCDNIKKIKLQEKHYIIGKGIAQGAMLSPILSDIYFDFILRKEMTMYLKTGKIIKYVDDILFVTENEVSAKQFLQLTVKGIPQYNCRFKKFKLQTNVSNDQNTVVDHIVYIGYKINCNTLEVEPNISNTNLRYSIFSSKQTSDPLKFLKLRLSNFSTLRLSKTVLDNKINSKTTIKSILKKIFLLQAKRACLLIKELFNDVQKYAQSIFKIIRSNNKKIARYIIVVFLKFEENMQESCIREWNQEILCMLWTSYMNVFVKDKILRRNFLKIRRK